MKTIDARILVCTEEKNIPDGIRARNGLLRTAGANIVMAHPTDSFRVLRLITRRDEGKVLELLGVNEDDCIDVVADGETVIHIAPFDRFAVALSSVLPGVSEKILGDNVFHPVIVVADGGISLSCASGLGVADVHHLINVDGEILWVDDPSLAIAKLDDLMDTIRMTVGGVNGSVAANSIRGVIDLLVGSVVWTNPEIEAAHRDGSDGDDDAPSLAN